jgi:Tol biopolymer transport system component
MRKVYFLISTLLLGSGIASAQKGPDFCKKFSEAAYDMNYANYDKALTAYQELVAQDPTNSLLNYNLGFCILNTGTSNKADAAKYLEVAEKNYVRPGGAIDEDDCMEKKAPTTCILDLGIAYTYAGQFGKAAEKFQLYSTIAKLKGEAKEDVDRKISQCSFADKQLKNPKKATFTNLGPEINSAGSDYDAFITEDEQAIYFNSRRKDFGNYPGMDGRYWESIFFSMKDGEKWISADLIGPNVNEEENDAILGFSADGTKMLVYKDKKENGNIFLSEYKSDAWTTPVELGPTINTKFKDRGATISPDGQTVIFASDKKGGVGGMDLYSSTRANGTWGPATAIASLNTKYDEMAPSFSRDGKSLYFASNGYDVIGGLDIFVSKWNGSGYDAPENLGAPVNTIDDDYFYSESLDGTRAYVSQNRKDGLGDLDIYMVTFPDKTPNNITVYSGNFKLTDAVKEIPSSNKITVTNLADNSVKTYKVTPDGKFSFILKPNGKYSVKIEQGTDVLFEESSIATSAGYAKMQHADIALPLTPEQVVVLAKQAAEDKAKEEKAAQQEAAINAAAKESNIDFKMNFQYNKKDITASNDFSDFSKLFIKAVKAGKVNVHLEACASKVPTSKYPNNEALSLVRAEAAKTKIMELITKNKLNPANVVFDKADGLVGGPEYNKDWNENRKTYEKFQYIYIKVSKLK